MTLRFRNLKILILFAWYGSVAFANDRYIEFYRQYEAQLFGHPKNALSAIEDAIEARPQNDLEAIYFLSLMGFDAAIEISHEKARDIHIARASNLHWKLPKRQRNPLFWCFMAEYAYSEQFDKKKIKEYSEKCEVQSAQRGNFYIARSLFRRADHHTQNYDYLSALNYLTQAIETLSTEEEILRARILNSLAIVNSELGDRKLALSYYRQAIEIFEKLNVSYYAAVVYHNYSVDADFDPGEQLQIYQRMQVLCKQAEDQLCEGHAFHGIGQAQTQLLDLPEANSAFLTARSKLEEFDPEMHHIVGMDLARNYKTLAKYSEAISFASAAYQFFDEKQLTEEASKALLFLSELEELRGNWQGQVKYLKSQLDKQRSIINQLQLEAESKASAKYRAQVVVTEDSNKVLQQINQEVAKELQAKGKTLRETIIIASILALLLAIVFFAYKSSKKVLFIVKENAEIREAMIQERNRYAENFQNALRTGIKLHSHDKVKIYYQPAENIGGDWYFAFEDTENHHIYLAIADVSGHGFGSALLTFTLYGLFEGLLPKLAAQNQHLTAKIKELVDATNSTLWDICPKIKKHVTFFVAAIDRKNMDLYSVNLGHNAPCLIEGKKVIFLKSRNSPLGHSQAIKYEVAQHSLDKSSLLFLYTDGLIENANFGPKRFNLRQALNLIKDHEEFEARFESLLNHYQGKIKDIRVEDDTTIILWQAAG